MTENQEIPDIFKNLEPRKNNQEVERLEKQANQVIRNLTETYIENAQIQLHDLERYIAEIRQLTGQAQAQLIKENLFRTAHDMKGQGATFGYPLLTRLGAKICDRIRNRNEWNKHDLNEFESDIADIKTVLQFPPNSENNTLKAIEQRLDNLKD